MEATILRFRVEGASILCPITENLMEKKVEQQMDPFMGLPRLKTLVWCGLYWGPPFMEASICSYYEDRTR